MDTNSAVIWQKTLCCIFENWDFYTIIISKVFPIFLNTLLCMITKDLRENMGGKTTYVTKMREII